jgi:hypothetical protein
MVTIASLWLPILLSAVFVFVVSSIMHMLLPYHESDFKKVPSEDEVMESLRNFDIPPGDYMIPCGEGMKSMKDPAFIEKMNKGPVAMMTVVKSGPPSMSKSLFLWFIYNIIVSIFAAYIASRALTPNAHYLQVFRFAGATAFFGYSVALLQNSIWYSRKWSTTIKSMFDGFIYALVTAGTFGWLWPGM